MGNYCIQDRVNSFYNLDENEAQLHAALLGSEAPSYCGSRQQRMGSSVSLSLGAPTPGSSAPRAPVLLFTSSSCTVVAWLEGSFLKDAALSVTLTHYTSGSSPLVREMLTAEGCINWAVGDMEYGCCNYLLRGQRRRKNFP